VALTHRLTKRIDLPHEEGQWIEARMPSLAILDRAKEAKSRRAIAMMEGIDLRALQGLTGDQRTDTPDYDPLTLLQACITGWSYEDPVTADNVAELDEVTVGVVMRALLPQEDTGERKNGSGESMMHSKVTVLRPKSS